MVAQDFVEAAEQTPDGNMALLSPKLPWELAQTKWSGILNPLISLPILNGNMIENISLTASTPLVINHLLQRMPQGWFLTDATADAIVWRTAVFNKLTITLESDADTTISFWIF